MSELRVGRPVLDRLAAWRVCVPFGGDTPFLRCGIVRFSGVVARL